MAKHRTEEESQKLTEKLVRLIGETGSVSKASEKAGVHPTQAPALLARYGYRVVRKVEAVKVMAPIKNGGDKSSQK